MTIDVTMQQMGQDAVEEVVRAAREALAQGRWQRVLDLVGSDACSTSPECLELTAEAAYGAGEFERCIGAWEDLHSLQTELGDHSEAARAAAMIGMYLMMDTGLMAPVRGWLRCAERHIADTDEHPVQAIIAMVRGYERFMCGSMGEARLHATAAIDLGERFGVFPAVVIGRTCTARLEILEGDVDEGIELLEEVGALLMSGAADPLTTGMMYCEIICAAQGLLRPEMAAQWTDVMENWRNGSAFGGIHGRCRVHRAELLRHSGTCELAEAEALAACAELRPWMRREFGWPLVELGNIRLRTGDLDGAEEAYLQAIDHSWSAQPGLAMVYAARGELDTAASMIADAIDHPVDIPSKERPPFGPLRRAPLIDAQAEIAAARGDRSTLEAAANELREIADRFPSSMLRAFAGLAEARRALTDFEPDHEAVVSTASSAVGEFNAVGAAFEAAMARLVVAEGYDAGGHIDQAAFERRHARDGLASFGAEMWAERVDGLIERAPTRQHAVTTETESAARHAVFRSDGDTRTVGWGAASVVVRDLKGMRYIARLLAEPGREFHASQLVGLETAGESSAMVDTGFVVLDDAAKESYRRRLIDIDDEIAEARADNDLGRVELGERDREYLLAELRRASGLGGRDRVTLDGAERARVSVTRSIRYALDRLAEHSPDIAAHLHQRVRTGTYLCYEQDALRPIDWVVR